MEKWLGFEPPGTAQITASRRWAATGKRYVCVETMHGDEHLAIFFFRHDDGFGRQCRARRFIASRPTRFNVDGLFDLYCEFWLREEKFAKLGGVNRAARERDWANWSPSVFRQCGAIAVPLASRQRTQTIPPIYPRSSLECPPSAGKPSMTCRCVGRKQ